MANRVGTRRKKTLVLGCGVGETRLLRGKRARERVNLVLLLHTLVAGKRPVVVGRADLVRHHLVVVQQTLQHLFNRHRRDALLLAP